MLLQVNGAVQVALTSTLRFTVSSCCAVANAELSALPAPAFSLSVPKADALVLAACKEEYNPIASHQNQDEGPPRMGPAMSDPRKQLQTISLNIVPPRQLKIRTSWSPAGSLTPQLQSGMPVSLWLQS